MPETCIYCGNSKSSKLTGEHSISRGVFEIFFYPIEYIGIRTKSELFGDKTLANTQPRIKDVCIQCNSDLHIYDDNGKILAQAINPFADITGVKLPFNEKILGWLIKTHLNCIRTFPNKDTRKKYAFNKSIFEAIINYEPIPTDLYKLCVEGWQGIDYLWDGPKRMNAFYYTSVELLQLRILVSDLRLKTFKTFLLLPTDSDYTNFENRSKSAIEEMKRGYGFHVGQIQTEKSIQDGFIYVHDIKPLKEILDGITKTKW
jgi:hypothetical protein